MLPNEMSIQEVIWDCEDLWVLMGMIFFYLSIIFNLFLYHRSESEPDVLFDKTWFLFKIFVFFY